MPSSSDILGGKYSPQWWARYERDCEADLADGYVPPSGPQEWAAEAARLQRLEYCDHCYEPDLWFGGLKDTPAGAAGESCGCRD